MHKNATKCNKTQSKWCVNKHGASKIIDTFETYQLARSCDPYPRPSWLQWISRPTRPSPASLPPPAWRKGIRRVRTLLSVVLPHWHPPSILLRRRAERSQQCHGQHVWQFAREVWHRLFTAWFFRWRWGCWGWWYRGVPIIEKEENEKLLYDRWHLLGAGMVPCVSQWGDLGWPNRQAILAMHWRQVLQVHASGCYTGHSIVSITPRTVGCDQSML
jgi:hypothetical protein